MLSRFVVTIAALFLVTHCRAVNYYFSVAGSDAYTTVQAQSKATPWKTIAKLNTFSTSLKPGDSVLFKCGDTFAGTIAIAASGTAALPIVVGSYGTGAKPIISGLVPATGWVSLGGGIYQASCPLAGATVNVALYNGIPQQIGRYPNVDAPNKGYVNIDSHVGNTQITASTFGSAQNWTGAEVVIRKNHWIIDRGTISSNTTTVVNYTDASPYQPAANFGFFIQNHPNTLDELGEWYYNPASKQIMMYFGSVVPTNTSVQVSSTTNLLNISFRNYITITGLAFVGSNSHSLLINNAIAFVIKNCTITASGGNGVYANTTTALSVTNTSIQYANNNAIASYNSVRTNISNDSLKNIGAVAGMGLSGDGTYNGVLLSGKSAMISTNVLTNIGYDGISFGQGDSTVVKNNYISNFELVKEDGGGIYSYAGEVDSLTSFYGRQITDNIILNTIGATPGTNGTSPSYAAGIYLDVNCTGISITGNSISNCLTGIFFHESRGIVFSGNTLFNNQWQVYFSHNTTKFTSKANVLSNNIIYSLYKTQYNLNMQTINVGVQTFGTFSNNYYSPTIDNIFPINAATKLLNLQLWQNLYGKDITSVNTVAIPFYQVSMPVKRSLFSNTQFNVNINNSTAWSANGNFLATWDNTNALDGPSLKAYFSFVSGSPTDNPMMQMKVGAVAAAVPYMLKFSLKATHTNRRLMIFLLNNSSPYNQVSETKYLVLDSVRAEHSIMMVPTVPCANTVAVLRLENEDITEWLDNFGFYATTSTQIDPNTQVLYKYNASTSSINVKLASTYIDSKNVVYKGSATIAPFSSLLLFKKADTVLTMPPIVYNAPNASKDLVAFSQTQKAASIGVYPNPASDYIMLNFNSSDVKDLTIKLLSTKGDIILNQQVQVSDSSYRLDLSQKPKPGCYIIQLSGSGISQTSKVIII